MLHVSYGSFSLSEIMLAFSDIQLHASPTGQESSVLGPSKITYLFRAIGGNITVGIDHFVTPLINTGNSTSPHTEP